MRIDVSTTGIDTILFGNADGEWLRATEAAHFRRADEAEAADMALRTDYTDAIRKALQTASEEASAIEAARKSVEQETIDTPENIRLAALNLLTFGV